MAKLHEGKFFILYLLLILHFRLTSRVFSNPDAIVTETDQKSAAAASASAAGGDSNVLNQGQFLEKLEQIVRNLTELVSRLESRLSASPEIQHSDDQIRKKVNADKKFVGKMESGGFENRVRDGEKTMGAVSVAKYSAFWSEKFQFVSAVKLDSDPTSINVLPFRDQEGLSKYVAVGDDRGRVYVFLRNGDVLIEFYTQSNSPVTSIVSYLSVLKNESVVITGHENGDVFAHRVWEVSNSDEWSSPIMETIVEFNYHENHENKSPITILEVHHVGRIRYILSVGLSGKIRVFRENGTVYGLAVPRSRPLAFLKQRLLFLTETGAGSLDLRTMKIRESECEGLNETFAKNYVFDTVDRSKAYGLTSDGDLIHLMLMGDIVNFKCRVRSKKRFEMEEPLAFNSIKGYLLIVNRDKVFVYNVSSQHYVRAGGPRALFSASFDEIVGSFLGHENGVDLEKRRAGVPLLGTDREKLVVLSLSGGYIGMYRSNLPIFKNEFNTMLWTSPVLFFILFLFGAWHFFANKKEALTSWGPDDLFVSGSGSGGFGDITDFRGGGGNGGGSDGGLRGPPARSYVSPSRFPSGGGSYRGGSGENANPRVSSGVDPNYRAASELKYRGSNLESSGFQKEERVYL